MYRIIASMAACLTLFAESASAHPGHGVTDPESPAHFVLEPLHAVPVLLAVLAIVSVRGISALRRTVAVRREQNSDA